MKSGINDLTVKRAGPARRKAMQRDLLYDAFLPSDHTAEKRIGHEAEEAAENRQNSKHL